MSEFPTNKTRDGGGSGGLVFVIAAPFEDLVVESREGTACVFRANKDFVDVDDDQADTNADLWRAATQVRNTMMM